MSKQEDVCHCPKTPGPDPLKKIPALIYAGICVATPKKFDLEFSYKIYGIAKSSVDLRRNFFYRIGSRMCQKYTHNFHKIAEVLV